MKAAPPGKADDELKDSKRHELRCPICGRFAHFLRDRHYYNGWFDCYSYTTRCSRCGDVVTECV